MRSRQEKTRKVRFMVALCVVSAAGLLFTAQTAWAGERQFLVILANSPKQYPGPERDPLGQPADGLINPQGIHNQYFDRSDPWIGSFAEYWEEISYGDVKISGQTTDWISLPWAIQPPLLDEERDNPDNPPLDDNMFDPTVRNSPSNFYDLNGDGLYRYGKDRRILLQRPPEYDHRPQR